MKRWLDRITGLVTMYVLVIVLLTAIGVIALVMSLVGVLSYPVLALLASAAVSVGVTIGSSWVIARIARVTPHLPSAVITGLLIFFIMIPTLDLVGLAVIGLAGLIASVSKYVIAVRGRHVLNPAALGTFVVGVLVFSGVLPFATFPGWWVGTSALLIPVAISAFLVLYRTQRLVFGGVFLALVIVIGAAAVLLREGSPLDALTLTILSSPWVFFAGFMLSEPLTLPPRRWQQLVEAAIVAVLIPIPFGAGPVTNTPQLALLVGNVFAFLTGQRRGIRLTYLGKTALSPTTWELSFQPKHPVSFLPGQYMELAIPHRKEDFRGSRRYFSISSAPTADGPITFAISLPSKSSSFKRALLDLEPGAAVVGTSVGGDFALPREVSEPLLLIAGGIGITPFASQLAHATERGEKRDVTVVYATSAPGSMPYAELLERSGARVVLFAPDAPTPLPPNWVYGGAERVSGDRLAETVPDVAARRTFISGPPALVSDLRRAARSQGARHVHTDYFSGY